MDVKDVLNDKQKFDTFFTNLVRTGYSFVHCFARLKYVETYSYSFRNGYKKDERWTVKIDENVQKLLEVMKGQFKSNSLCDRSGILNHITTFEVRDEHGNHLMNVDSLQVLVPILKKLPRGHRYVKVFFKIKLISLVISRQYLFKKNVIDSRANMFWRISHVVVAREQSLQRKVMNHVFSLGTVLDKPYSAGSNVGFLSIKQVVE
jgi:hypothetical protein